MSSMLTDIRVASPGQDGPTSRHADAVAPPSCQLHHGGAGEGSDTLGGADRGLSDREPQLSVVVLPPGVHLAVW